MTQVIELTDKTFDIELKKTTNPVLVDFFAPWCGHCRVQEPILDKLSEELKDEVVVAKINVDDNRTTAARYFISGIPAILLFKNGKLVEQKAGVQHFDELKKIMEYAKFILSQRSVNNE